MTFHGFEENQVQDVRDELMRKSLNWKQ